jgi:hypothetical protein
LFEEGLVAGEELLPLVFAVQLAFLDTFAKAFVMDEVAAG